MSQGTDGITVTISDGRPSGTTASYFIPNGQDYVLTNADKQEIADLLDDGVPTLVTDWLDDNVTPVGSAVVVDSSLSVQGAAADAKAVGDKFADVIGEGSAPTPGEAADLAPRFIIINGKVITADGTESDNSGSNVVDYFAVTPGKTYTFIFTSGLSVTSNTRVHAYNASKQWISQVALITTTERRDYSEEITVPSGTAYLRISFSDQHTIKNFLSFSFNDTESDDFVYVEGKYINSSGEPSDNANFHYADFIPVSTGKYAFAYRGISSQAATRVYGYDAQHNPVAELDLNVTTTQDIFARDISVSSTVKYVRISIAKQATILFFGKLDGGGSGSSGEYDNLTNLTARVKELEDSQVVIETDDTLSVEGAAADAKAVGDRFGEIIGYADRYLVDLAPDFTYTDGSWISADGTETTNSNGKVVNYFSVIPGKTYTFVFTSTMVQTNNCRVHGYNSSKQWVSQVAVIETNKSQDYTVSITVPSGVAYLRIAITKQFTIKEFSYIHEGGGGQLAPFDTLGSITERVTNLENSKIRVGDPYVYLSEPIEDEILDSKTCDDVYAIYDGLCTNHPETFVRLSDIGAEASQNLPLRMYRMKWTTPVVTATEASWNQADNIYQSDYDGFKRLFISAGTHGNEKSSAYGVALAIKEIVESDSEFAKYIRGNFALDIVPIVNPAGFNATTRNNGSNVNINRDFLTRNTAEAQAVYNVLTSNEYYACIDSHNSGGNANYIGIPNTNPRYKEYIKIGMKFGQIMFNDWKTLATGEQYATSPYTQFWLHTPGAGMMQDLFTELGLVGWLIESVGVFASSNGTLTPNHKKYCKFTKDLLINSIICLGTNEWN